MVERAKSRVVDESTAEIGRRVRAARRARGMNQRALSEAAKISRDTLVSLERGKRHTLPETLEKVAKVLKIPFEELFEAGVYQTTRARTVVGQAPPGQMNIHVKEGASLREVLDAAVEAYERSRERSARAEKLSAGVMDARTALATAGTRRKPRGVPRERAVEMPPGEGLTEAVLEERVARPY